MLSYNEAQAAALRLLARREHSALELRRKLQQRGHTAELIEGVLQRLMEQDILSDTRFAECYTRMRTGNGYGPIRIAAELRERGVAEDIAVHYVDAASEDWAQKAREARHKRFGTPLPKHFADQAKEMRFLQYRGFSHEQIKSVYAKVISDAFGLYRAEQGATLEDMEEGIHKGATEDNS